MMRWENEMIRLMMIVNDGDEYSSLPLFVVQYINIIEPYYVTKKLSTPSYKEPGCIDISLQETNM